MNRERIKGHLDLLLLSVLLAGPDHGYAVITALRDERTQWHRFAAGIQSVVTGLA
ncbi:MAG TPA: hypothetical protein VH089_16865 [Streptosporangiaceae bacterium]|jgi:DNA-binding PadR family transcriptional regulator|nr:hypothetical protein [Streptosporangiaceae bacterium]